MNIASLLQEQNTLLTRIKKTLYGSIEIREQNGKKLIYVHYIEDGLRLTKYAGEYTKELHNLILENNELVKQCKKRLKEIKKELDAINYSSTELNDAIKLNVDLARKNMVDSIYKQAVLEGVATTYSDTETIVEGGIVKNMTASDISKVVNLKRAW
ncbi:MAG: cell filamentation protein Fic, partial [Clostridia bacterium]|nr:cell filamentation protein Fic [Clostridia bacterium]